MSFQQLVRELTESLMKYVHTPAQERKRRKQEWKSQQGSWSHRWFGLMPTAARMTLRPVLYVLVKLLSALGGAVTMRRKSQENNR